MKKHKCLIVLSIFVINCQIYLYSNNECLLMQRDTSIILTNIESETEYVLISVLPNSRFDVVCINNRKYIIIYDGHNELQFKTKKINQYSSDIYVLSKDTMLLHVGQLTCSHLESNNISKEYNIMIDKVCTNYIQRESAMVLDKEQDRFPFHRSNTIKGTTIYSAGGNLYMQNNNKVALLMENSVRNNPKAMNGLYYPHIRNDGKKVCFSWKKRMMDQSYSICEYTLRDNEIIELPIKGTFPIYSSNANHLLIKKKNLIYMVYSFRKKKAVKYLRDCVCANWITL